MPDGPANPHGVGFCATETKLRTELEAQRNGDPVKSRIWKVKNPNVLNPLNGALSSLPRPLTFTSQAVLLTLLTTRCPYLSLNGNRQWYAALALHTSYLSGHCLASSTSRSTSLCPSRWKLLSCTAQL